MEGGDVELVVEADPEAASARAAALLADAVRAGSAIALSGGATPRRAYELAAGLEPDWGRATVWLADERCVPADDHRSNARLVRESVLERVIVPPLFRGVETALAPPTAADRYDALLREEGVPDLVVLGVGADGHTASLFPSLPALDAADRLAVATAAGLEPWVDRVTMTLTAITASDHVVFLVTGVAKSEVVRRAFADPPSPATPASLARSATGATTVVLDRAAARRL